MLEKNKKEWQDKMAAMEIENNKQYSEMEAKFKKEEKDKEQELKKQIEDEHAK